MNKKMTAIGLSIAVGVTMLATSAFAAVSSTSVYDTYKSAIKNITTVKSVTATVAATVKDNENIVVSFNSNMKNNRDNKSMSQSTTIAAGSEKKITSTYLQDGKKITKNSDSDIYNVIAMSTGRRQMEDIKISNPNDPKVKGIENIVDALVGNIQSFVKLDNETSGTKDVSLSLSNEQVPAVVNAALSMFEQNRLNPNENRMHKLSDSKINFEDKLPKLTDNIKVSNIKLNAKINKDNFIENQIVTITVTGNDVNGASHIVVLSVDAAFTNYNSTTPDTIDLKDKQVKNIAPKDMGELRNQE